MIEYAIREYLELITGMDVSPVSTHGPFPAMTYKISPYSEGTVKECQLEVRVISENMEECLEIRAKVIQALNTDEQQPSIVMGDYAVRAQVSGGGWLFNSETNMWEYPTLFNLLWR